MSHITLNYCTYLHGEDECNTVYCWMQHSNGKFDFRLNDDPYNNTHSDFFTSDEMQDALCCGRISETEITIGTRYRGTESQAKKLLDQMDKKFPDAKIVYCGSPIFENLYQDA